jgi:uncharacterized protein
MPDHPPDLEPLSRSWAVLLTTFKRDGTGVGTPVNLAVEGDRAYFRTYSKTWKTRRLDREPRVEVAPCTPRGTRCGPALGASARLLGGDEEATARRALARRHPVFQRFVIPWGHRIARFRTMHYELTFPDEA